MELGTPPGPASPGQLRARATTEGRAEALAPRSPGLCAGTTRHRGSGVRTDPSGRPPRAGRQGQANRAPMAAPGRGRAMARNPSEAHTTVLCRAAQPRGPAEAAEPWEPTLWSHRERLSPPPPRQARLGQPHSTGSLISESSAIQRLFTRRLRNEAGEPRELAVSAPNPALPRLCASRAWEPRIAQRASETHRWPRPTGGDAVGPGGNPSLPF